MNIIDIINDELQNINENEFSLDPNNMISYIPQGYEHKILDETYQSIDEINKLADNIIKKVAGNNYPLYYKDRTFKYIYGINLHQIDNILYHEIRDFVKDSNIQIYFEPKDKESTTGANYSQIHTQNKQSFNPKSERDINIFYDYDELKKAIDTLIADKDNEGKVLSTTDIYSKFYHRFHSPLIHELQHAYDDYRSKGMAYNTKKFNKYLEKYSDNINSEITKDQVKDAYQYKAYLNLPHEIWARFSQTMKELHFYNFDFDKDFFTYTMYPMKEVIKRFRYKFNGYALLSDEMKKKLIRKVAQFWYIEQEKVKELNIELAEQEQQYNQNKINTVVNEELKNIMEAISVYHGSDRKFDTFDTEKISSGDGKSLGGWGIYFSDSPEVSKRYVTSSGFLKDFEISSGNYFDLDQAVDDGDRIIRQLQKLGIDDSEIEEFQNDYLDYDVTNKQVYEWLSYVLGGEKEASQFLENLGYIGNIFMDKWDVDARNYVVFNARTIKNQES